MKPGFAVLVTLLIASGCSAPEGANRAPRCRTTSDCPNGLSCYREFCVIDDSRPVSGGREPAGDAESGNALIPDASEPAAMSSDASLAAPPTADASAPAAIEAGQSAPAPAPMGGDEGGAPVQPGPEPEADAGANPLTDAATPDDPIGTLDDAGPIGTDASVADAATSAEVNRDLTRCLLLCSRNDNYCYSCFRSVVREHPEICAPGSGSDEIVRLLCGLVCVGNSCGAQ